MPDDERRTAFRVSLAGRRPLSETDQNVCAWSVDSPSLALSAVLPSLPLTGDRCAYRRYSLSAEYVDHLMNWVQGMIDDESIFPSQIGKGPFWPSSRSLAKMRDVEDILQGLMMELARMQASPSETISSPQSSRSTAGSSGSMRTCTTTTLRNSARSASRVSLVCSPTSSEQGRVAETVSDTVRSPPQHILPPLCALP